jgi:hypothetical protein
MGDDVPGHATQSDSRKPADDLGVTTTMSGPIIRKYGFPNHDQIFGERPLEHGAAEEEAATKEPTEAGQIETETKAPGKKKNTKPKKS